MHFTLRIKLLIEEQHCGKIRKEKKIDLAIIKNNIILQSLNQTSERVSSPKNDFYFCHNLLTLMSFQTCMSYFLMLNLKEDILKNAGNQTVVGPH